MQVKEWDGLRTCRFACELQSAILKVITRYSKIKLFWSDVKKIYYEGFDKALID